MQTINTQWSLPLIIVSKKEQGYLYLFYMLYTLGNTLLKITNLVEENII